MPAYLLHPQDLLFFRDSRPMTAGEGTGGHGARWPEPSLIFDALHAALHRAVTDKTGWHPHSIARHGRALNALGGQYFGSLQTAGLFPVVQDALGHRRWLFPCPADVVRAIHGERADCLQAMAADTGMSDLPDFLEYVLASGAEPDKTPLPSWWSRKAWQAYLGNKELPTCPTAPGPPILSELSLFDTGDLFTGEWHTGIGMDPHRRTQDGERLYSAEYLRLRVDVAMGFTASTAESRDGAGGGRHERMEDLFPRNHENRVAAGGQQRVCSVEEVKGAILTDLLPVSAEIQGRYVKWVLLSPAVFPHIKPKPAKPGCPAVPAHPGGWLPNWIDPKDGTVKLVLRTLDTPRRWDAQRQRTMREASGDRPIPAKLVAARVPKAVPITGWSDRVHLEGTELARPAGPRQLHLAVPAGTVYYFEGRGADEAEKQLNAQRLAHALSWHGNPGTCGYGTRIVHRRSSLFGEKGFGLGVCGNWHPAGGKSPESPS